MLKTFYRKIPLSKNVFSLTNIIISSIIFLYENRFWSLLHFSKMLQKLDRKLLRFFCPFAPSRTSTLGKLCDHLVCLHFH